MKQLVADRTTLAMSAFESPDLQPHFIGGMRGAALPPNAPTGTV